MSPDVSNRVGLCATCAHVQIVGSSKGSTFYLCRLSETDARFVKYPALPVLACEGYVRAAPAPPAALPPAPAPPTTK
jgi:hypothetical protein